MSAGVLGSAAIDGATALTAAVAGCAGAAAGLLTAPVVAAYHRPPGPRGRAAIAGLTAAVLAVLALRFGPGAELVAFAYLGVAGVLLAVVDAVVKRLPDRLTLPSYPIGFALLALAVPFTGDGPARLVHALIGMAVLWLFYFIQHFLMPKAMGRGDVKLSGVLGLYLGWLGEAAWVTGVVAGFLFGGVYSVIWMLLGKAGRKDEMPYGPFMLAGTLAGVLVGGWFAR
ncbi:prepilin peptidase [Actinomadura roseirufa]|uniref:prepilin peptidase n=1 Tax=Actinomadura roseirufa TaxID=2094049 RepID=UPI001041486D|nr:A24 family peptidase [Actinomadura roseirufa]